MKRVPTILLGAFASLLLQAAICGANLIAYNHATPKRSFLMVMEDMGADPVEIYSGGNFSGAAPLTISPLGQDEEAWVAFEEYDHDRGSGAALYKVAAGGGGLVKMLCAVGTDSEGMEYGGIFDPQWSPDGSTILVKVMYLEPFREVLALLPADFAVGVGAVGQECASPDLVPIDYFGQTAGDTWGIEGTAAWNDDGSQIAFFEFEGYVEENGKVRLTVLDRSAGTWAVRDHIELVPRPAYPDFSFPLSVDWQRNGTLLAFSSREETNRRPNFWLAFIDSSNGSWWRHEKGGEWVDGRSPSWSPDGSQLIYNDKRGDLFRLTLSTGEIEPLVSGKWADWQRDPLSTCSSDAECGEGKLCDTDSGVCFVPECGALGLPDCDDFDDCTVDTCIDYQCDFDPTAAEGLFCDDGDFCTEDDVCDASGVCEGALNTGIPGCEPSSCGAVGDPCSSGGDCCSGLCHPKKGVCK